VLKEASGPRILHLATHGSSSPISRWILKRRHRDPLATPTSKHPRARTHYYARGLAFAGANQLRSGKDDDGLLTAQEIVGLDLHGTEEGRSRALRDSQRAMLEDVGHPYRAHPTTGPPLW
jgi:hypothetical protein